MNNRTYGDKGEKVAEIYLKKKGYRLVCTNYRTRLGEIDIVVEKRGYIIFCEVKTRKSERYGMPFEAVNLRKQGKIRRVAECFLQQKKYRHRDVRFDVLSISHTDGRYVVQHIIGAF